MDLTKNSELNKKLEELSPFKLKNLIKEQAAKEVARDATSLLNTGRGNPNWVAIRPRQAFIALQSYALTECCRTSCSQYGVAGAPHQPGIASRFEQWLKDHAGGEGVEYLREYYTWMLLEFAADPDELVEEMAVAAAGQQYMTPPRVLKYTEMAIRRYLDWALCGNDIQPQGVGPFDIFPTEGATAGIIYTFETLRANLLNPGDCVAQMVPIYSPYIGIPKLKEFGWEVLNIYADTRNDAGEHTWQYNPADIAKLRDPRYKLLMVVNPSNPPSYALAPDVVEAIKDAVAHNPQLMILTDDAYGNFVPGYRSLIDALPFNTISICTFSKFFGSTGWRLCAVALRPDNVFDKRLSELPAAKLAELQQRYESMSLNVSKFKFIDRIVAESRLVTFMHTAGLSGPQQALMALMSHFAVRDLAQTGAKYQHELQGMLHSRYDALWQGFGFEMPADVNRACYYCDIDMRVWAKKLHGDDFVAYMEANYSPLTLMFHMATEYGVVTLDGSGFESPKWSVRLSMSNLDATSYAKIGADLRRVLDQYAAAWQASTAK